MHASAQISFVTVPEKGQDREAILAAMAELQKKDASPTDGRTFAYMYDTLQDEHQEYVTKAQNMFMWENGLNPVAFPALRKVRRGIRGRVHTCLSCC